MLQTYFLDLLIIKRSKITIAAIDSTIGTALGTTHGSCLPLAFIVVLLPLLSTVSCSFIIVATGLNATLKYMSSPLVIPPCIPPLWLLRVRMVPLSE